LGGLAVSGLAEDRQEDDPSVWSQPIADPPSGTAKVKPQFSGRAVQVSAVRFPEGGGRVGESISVVFDCSVVD
jgi:hypothetical protein